MRTKGSEQGKQGWDRGKGIPRSVQSISIKFPPEIDKVLRSLPNRSEQIREWVIEGMRREGLLEDKQ